MTKQLFNDMAQWQKETFGEATTTSKLLHLTEEVFELRMAVFLNEPEKRLEFADCFFLLFGAAAADGMSYEDIIKAIEEKFEINKNRTWGKPDANGVVNHLKD